MIATAGAKPTRTSILALSVFAIAALFYFNKLPSPHVPHATTKSSNGGWATFSSTTEVSAGRAQNAITAPTLTESHEGGPRIRKATMIYDTDKFNAVYERAVDTHIWHGERWGHPTHVLRHDIVDAGFFNKPAFLLGIVINEMAKPYGQRAEWIVWFDADSIILNPMISWTLFLPPDDLPDIHFLGSRDQNGFNAGVFLLRVNDWTVNMLSEVVALRQLKSEVDLPFYDQSAIKWVVERAGYQEHFVYQPHNWWNSFGLRGPPYPSDRFILHFAGVDCCDPTESKSTTMGRWIDGLETDPMKYNIPMANTSMADEVKAYWNQFTKAKGTAKSCEEYLESKSNEDVKQASNELDRLIYYEADDTEKMTEGIKKAEEALAKAKKGGDKKKDKDKGKS